MAAQLWQYSCSGIQNSMPDSDLHSKHSVSELGGATNSHTQLGPEKMSLVFYFYYIDNAQA